MALFKEHNPDQQAEILAGKFPHGRFTLAKYIQTTNLYKLLKGLGTEYFRLEGNLNYASDEFSLIRTNDLINDWEKEYAINSGCFAGITKTQTIEERINNILTQISMDGTSTDEQFEAVALKLGFVVTVESGIDYISFPLTFPYVTIATEREARFTIVVDMANIESSGGYPYEFPFVFGDNIAAVLKCFFDKLKPSNVQLLYVNDWCILRCWLG